MKKHCVFLITFYLIVNCIHGQVDDGWVLKKDKNDIQIFIKSEEGSNVLCYKILTTINAPVSNIKALLHDIKSYPDWTPSLKTAEILAQLSKDEMYYYVDVDAPWPISNRDNIIHYQQHEDQISKTVEISLTGVPNYISKVSGVVRVTQSKGMWKLTPKDKDKTEVISIHSSNPSGSLPMWVVKIFIVNNIYNLFINLKEEIKRDKYRGFGNQVLEIQP